MPESLVGPSVSTAIGWKENEAGRSAYFASFLEAAASAAAAAVTEEAGRYESARVVATVTSQAMARLECHGTNVMPSGLLTLSQ